MRTREHLAEAYFYAGESFLALHQTAKAKEMFRKAILQNIPWYATDAVARAELAQLSK